MPARLNRPPFDRDPIDRLIVEELTKYNMKFMRDLRRKDAPAEDSALWTNYGLGLMATMEPHLLDAHEKTYDAYDEIYGLPFAKDEYLDRYHDYAQSKLRPYAFLVAYNAQASVRKIYERAKSEGWDEDLILEHLFRRFGPSTAEAVGTTELTRLLAFDGGLLIELLKDNGINAYRIWYTVPDERRCATCKALHGKTHDVWVKYGLDDGPPAHPRCRCWVLVTILGREER